MKKSLPIHLAALLLGISAHAETRTAAPTGVYTQIDTRAEIQLIGNLQSGGGNQKKEAAREIMAHPGKYCPAVFFSLAAYLFYDGRTNDAIFWMYAGRIRTRFDIRRCTDETVADALEVLNQQLPELLRLAQFEDLKNARRIMEDALAWDRETPYDYDPRWIALHGLGAFRPAADQPSAEPLTIPEKKWAALAEKNRKEYLADFKADMDRITPKQLAEIKAKIAELQAARR